MSLVSDGLRLILNRTCFMRKSFSTLGINLCGNPIKTILLLLTRASLKTTSTKPCHWFLMIKALKKNKTPFCLTLISEKKLNVLDLGCANGRWANILVPHCSSYVGVDISEEFIKNAKIKFPQNHFEFYAMPAERFTTERR